jgi:hypothetical protein
VSRFDLLAKRAVRLLRTARWLPHLKRRAWILEGAEQASGEPLAVLCAAGDQTRGYLAQLLFREGVRESDLGSLWLWDLASARRARKRGCSLVALQVEPFLRNFLEEHDWFFVPLWVVGTIALPIPAKALKHKSIRSDLQALHNAGLQSRVTKDPECFDDFYHEMYVPHVTKAHASSVYVTPYDEMRARLDDSELILVHDEVRDVAGMMILYEDARPRLWSAGVRDGDRRYLMQGALAALYHFSFQHLTARNFGSANTGLSRAFLEDGVLRYKRKWGQRLEGTSAARIALKVVSDTPASRSCLQSNPFVFERSGALYGAVFLPDRDAVTADDVHHLRRQYWHDGLAKLILFSPIPRNPSDELPGLEMPPDVALESYRYSG